MLTAAAFIAALFCTNLAQCALLAGAKGPSRRKGSKADLTKKRSLQ